MMTLRDRVGDGISNHPAISRIIEQHLIEYYCREERSLKEACRSAQVDTEIVLGELHGVVSHNHNQHESNFATLSLTGTCDEIESTHYQYLKQELPRLKRLIAKVLSVHGDQHAWLLLLADYFDMFCEELNPHMFKEEQIL